jgi:GDPmannose 4,6-dehydratase
MDALRDWGHARDYVEIQWLMLQQDKPDDYVIASGHQISVREFIQKVALKLEMQLEWQGTGLSEKAYWKTKSSEKCIISVDPEYYRPTEVETLLGDATKAHKQLGWKPKSNIDELIEEMVDSDMILARQEEILRESKSK